MLALLSLEASDFHIDQESEIEILELNSSNSKLKSHDNSGEHPCYPYVSIHLVHSIPC